MPLYHPRILAHKLEELILTLLRWSHTTAQTRHAALARQSKMEAQLAGTARTAGILADQLAQDQHKVVQVSAALDAQTTLCLEAKKEAEQAAGHTQRTLNEARQVLVHWQTEQAHAEQWEERATTRLQHAEGDYARIVNAPEHSSRTGEAHKTTAQAAAAHLRAVQINAANAEIQSAQRELRNAQTRVTTCTRAIAYAGEAVQLAQQARERVGQGINASERSLEHTVAAQKALEEGKRALGREEEAVRATEEALKVAQHTQEEATQKLHSALVHEQLSQTYQARARVTLEEKILALLALNQPDSHFTYGGVPADTIEQTGGAVGVEQVAMVPGLCPSPAAESATALKKDYAGPQSDPELASVITHLSKQAGLVPQRWSTLREDQREKILRTAHADIARVYGFTPYPLEIQPLAGKLNGYCRHNDKIVINSKLLARDHPRQALETLAHESRHAYQFYAIDQPFWFMPVNRRAAVRTWRENMVDYKDSQVSFEAYFKQPVEVDARAFGSAVVSQVYGGR